MVKIREYEAKTIGDNKIVRGQLLNLAYPVEKKLFDAFWIVTGSQKKYHGLWIVEKKLVYRDTIKEIL